MQAAGLLRLLSLFPRPKKGTNLQLCCNRERFYGTVWQRTRSALTGSTNHYHKLTELVTHWVNTDGWLCTCSTTCFFRVLNCDLWVIWVDMQRTRKKEEKHISRERTRYVPSVPGSDWWRRSPSACTRRPRSHASLSCRAWRRLAASWCAAFWAPAPFSVRAGTSCRRHGRRWGKSWEKWERERESKRAERGKLRFRYGDESGAGLGSSRANGGAAWEALPRHGPLPL